MQEHLTETTLSKEDCYKGRVITVQKWRVRLPGGKQAERDVVLHFGGVAVVAVDEEGMVYMVEQYRTPFEEIVRELPAGKLNSAYEEPYHAALRELEEETGLCARRLEHLHTLYVSPGYCAEKIHIYMAHGLEKRQSRLDEDEFLDCVRLPFKNALNDVLEGRIVDAKTVAGILSAARKLGL